MFLEDDGEPELRELAPDECLRLLGDSGVGRLAVAPEGKPPLVVPINYVVDGGDVVFRTSPGEKLRLLRGRPVSFQMDQVDHAHRTGWSVLITGSARQFPAEEAEHLRVRPWVGSGDCWVRITPEHVSGRRIRGPEIQQDQRGYL